MGSSNKARLPRASRLGWARGVLARFTHPNRLQGIDRAEFEQIASDLDLSHAELYQLMTGSSVSGEVLEQRLAALELPGERIRAAQASEAERISVQMQVLLPVGPSCC